MVSTEDSNRVGGAEFSAEEVHRRLVEIADAVIGRPVSIAEMCQLMGDDDVLDMPLTHEPGTILVQGFRFEKGGYSFTIHRVGVDVPEEMTV